jgi:hypothetical protein
MTMRSTKYFALLVFALALAQSLFAGGPLYVGGRFGTPGKAFVWDNSKPVAYRVDGGALGRLTNAQATARVQTLFQAWQNVPTANISFSNAGPILSTTGFSDGDVSTADEFDAVAGSCGDGTQSPIIFDADGSIFKALGMPDAVIGFASACMIDDQNHYVSAMAVMNGSMLGGSSPYQLTDDEFDAAFIHEFGHLIGLDHSQINVNCYVDYGCSANDVAGLPTMFPILMTAEQKSLSEDDMAWVSYLYPVTQAATGKTLFSSVYGVISGKVLFGDGISGAQGVNVIARQTSDGIIGSRSVAYSSSSGYLFTGNPGQAVTGTNADGSMFGSRDPLLIGRYDIPVKAGNYIVEIESLNPDFTEGSGIGPLSNALPEGRGKQIPLAGAAVKSATIQVTAGSTTTTATDLTMGPGPSRFDQYESQ